MLEICCFDLESCIKAEKAGADRIELCANKTEGGVTPSFGIIKLALELLKIPVFVMIRPRGGDFKYTDLEKKCMLTDIEIIRDLGAQGIVCGALLADGSVDEEFLKEIQRRKGNMAFTFHRAFDRCSDKILAIKILKNHNVDRILTSGLFEKAIDGIENLREIVNLASDNIKILVGSGVMPNNIKDFAKIGIREFHFSAGSLSETQMTFFNSNFENSENSYPTVNSELIKEAKQVIEKL
jgi:copper homeostasis protein